MKGINPKAREVAKDLARRSGMTLGEWLNRVILEDDVPEDVATEEQLAERLLRAPAEPPRPQLVSSNPFTRVDELARIAHVLDRLTDRIEAAETRTGLAITGVEHSVRQTVAHIEAAEREHVAIAARFESAVDTVATDQGRLAERLRRMETETSGPRSTEALRALEQSVSRVAGQLYEGEGRTRESLAAMETRLQRAEALSGGDPSALIDEVVRQLGQRLAEAEGRTGEALEGLRGALAQLDGRVYAAEAGAPAQVERRLEDLAANLTQRVEEARAEIAATLSATVPAQMEARLAEMGHTVLAAEQRATRAIEAMGREVLTIAETLNRRVLTAEQRSAQAIELVGGEVARIAGAVEARLDRANQSNSEALERLGAEIGLITERLTERLLHSERRAAQAIDDVGEQLARAAERIEQRHARDADHVHEAAELPAAAPEDDTPVAAAPFGPELFSRAEDDVDFAETAGHEPERPMFAAAPEADDGFAAPPEPEADLFGLDQPEPPVPEADLDGAKPLSTREVIAQARAAARAAAGQRPQTLQAKVKASWRLPLRRPAAAKPRHNANSTLQTAMMVAGGAAFLSVGAAGVVLLENPDAAPRLPSFVIAPLDHTQRPAAVTPAPQAAPPTPAPAPIAPVAEAAVPTARDQLIAGYAQVVRDVTARKPGALAQLKAVADAGHPPAEFFLGKLYETGASGVVQNLGEARRWTARAADGGDPAAMHNLGLYYFEGLGGTSDPTNAAIWFRKAAQAGVVDSQFNLGLLYQSGSGVERDPAEAYRWFTIAAAGGDAQARASAVALEPKLTRDQVASAQKAAEGFRAPVVAAGLADAAPPPSAVTAAQRILGRLGYYKGVTDGATTPALKVAVARYQRDQGLAATGLLDPTTVSRLSVFTR